MTKPIKPLPPSEEQNVRLISRYAQKIQSLYSTAVAEFARLGSSLGVDPSSLTRPFRLEDYPKTAGEASRILSTLQRDLIATIRSGQVAGWNGANVKNDALVSSLAKSSGIPFDKLSQYNQRNLDALGALQSRVQRAGGLGLSERVFRYTSQFKTEIDLGLSVGLASGKSSMKLASEMKRYLKEPDKLFRRVRNKSGQLRLSQAAKAYSPGQGVYRSSYKNALRLTVTEINSAYRESDFVRYQQLDFVVGIEIKLSPRHAIVDICDDLKGKYPKDFLFRGWHPLCRCYQTPILASKDELSQITRAALRGESGPVSFANAVTDVPRQFNQWASDNRERVGRMRTKPYFLSDNPTYARAALTAPPAPVPPLAVPPAPVRPPSLLLTNPGQHFANAGYTIISDNMDTFNGIYNTVASGIDFAALNTEITSMMAGKGILMQTRHLYGAFGVVRLELKGFHPSGPYQMDRTFKLDRSADAGGTFGARVVMHDYLKMPPDVQGGGLTKQLFQSLYRQYQAGGIARIDVHANIDVGGYAWARYGFSLTEESKRGFLLRRANMRLRGADLSAFNRFWAKFKDDDVFPMHGIAGTTFGKKLLLDSDWYGQLNLLDPLARQRFEAYLYKK